MPAPTLSLMMGKSASKKMQGKMQGKSASKMQGEKKKMQGVIKTPKKQVVVFACSCFVAMQLLIELQLATMRQMFGADYCWDGAKL